MMQPDKYKTLIRRLAASFFDALLLALPLIAFTANNGQAGEDTMASLNIANMFLPILYSVFMHYRYGQTLGKMALGIKVVHANEVDGLSLKQAVLRDTPWLILEVIGLLLLLTGFQDGNTEADWLYVIQSIAGNAATLWLVLELLTALTNSRRRAIHDFLANTVVVKAPAHHG